MKKALAMALGAVLVAGSAVPAAAATQVDFSGYYRVNYAVNGNLGYTSDDNLNESFFEHRLEGNLVFQATDEVSVVWRFRAPAGDRFGTGPGNLTTRFVYGQVVQDWGTVRVGRLANGVADQFGLKTLGWTPALDNVATFISPFEGATDRDGIQYVNSWDNGFGIGISYAKLKDGANRTASPYWAEADGSDHDTDRFQIEPTYKWDGGGVALNVIYQRDASANASTLDKVTPGHVDGSGRWIAGETTRAAGDRVDKTSAWYINPALMHSWGAFSAHFEGMFAFGETSFYNSNLASNHTNYEDDADAEGQGFYLDFDYNYGPGRVNLAGWWVSGNDVADQYDKDVKNDNDNNALADIVGGNFYPLVVAYGPINTYVAGNSVDGRRGVDGAVGVANQGGSFYNGLITDFDNTGIATTQPGDTVSNLINGGTTTLPATKTTVEDLAFTNATRIDLNRYSARDNGQANHWALMLSGQHAFTDAITFNYALAYLALNNPNYRVVDGFTVGSGALNTNSVSYHTQDKDLGWEIDLGVNVQLLDNLALTSTVGYMFTGDAYQQMKGYRLVGDNATDYSVHAEWEDADDAYTWFNSLTFSF